MASSCPQVGPGRVVAEPVQAATLVAAQEGIDRDVIIRLYEAAHAAINSVSQLTPSGIGDHLVVRALRSRCQHLLTMVLWPYFPAGMEQRPGSGCGDSGDVSEKRSGLFIDFLQGWNELRP